MTWRYSAPPEKELHWYPPGTRTYPGVPLLLEFDAWDGFDVGAMAEKLRRTGGHDITGDALPVRDNSGDSYRAFLRNFPSYVVRNLWEPENVYQARRTQKTRDRRAAIVSAEQQTWEKARLERLRLQRKASDAEWAAAERKVQAAEHDLLAKKVAERVAAQAEQAARMAAAQVEAERRRQQQQRALEAQARLAAEFYQNERREWVECLRNAIAECEGTPYAVLIPQMQGDIANIESQPPGALPWRFNRDAFYRHFESFKAKVGGPHRG